MTEPGMGYTVEITWDDVTGIHRILIFDEAKPVHQLDLRDLSGAMGAEMFFDVLFGYWEKPMAPREAP